VDFDYVEFSQSQVENARTTCDGRVAMVKPSAAIIPNELRYQSQGTLNSSNSTSLMRFLQTMTVKTKQSVR
jgi:hypothetical protein